MPSGFQQNANQLAPGFYRVVLTMTSTTYYPTTGGSENDRGGVTPNSSDSFSTANLPTTLAYGQNRARGNMRFRNIVNQLSGIADCQILDIEVDSDETNGDSQSTTLAFTVKFDRPDFVPSTGTDIAGGSITTQAGYIKNEVAKAIRLSTTANVRVYNGTAGTDNMLSITATHTGATASQTLGTVAVTLIDGTELTTADASGDAE
jgi:hypothetical protein